MKIKLLKRSIGCALAIILLLTQLTVQQASAAPVTQTLTILHTNDIHGHIEEDATLADGGTIGAAKYKTIINDYESKGDVLVFDAGDATHGTNFATLSDGENIISLMNDLGVDGFVPGNHDFNYGFGQLMNLQTLANFPMLASNVVEDATGTDPFTENYIYDMADYQVGVFGLATPETKTKSNPVNTAGLTFTDVVDAANTQVAALKAAGADVIIMLSHLGEDAASPINTFTVTQAVTGIDLVIDGHSHTLLPNGLTDNGTMIVSAGEHMQNIGHVEITISEGAVTGITANLITFDMAAAYPANPDMQAKIAALNTANSAVLDTVVGTTTTELDGVRDHVRTSETNLADLITDAMLAESGADVVITNGGGIRSSINVGDITMGEVLTVLPFENVMTVIEVTGQDILDALTYGVSAYPASAGKFPQVSGMRYQIVMDAAGNKVANVLVAGVPIDPAKTYKLATNDFMAVGGDGYTMFAGKTQVSLHGSLADILADYINSLTAANGAVTYVKDNRITVAPYLLKDDQTGSALVPVNAFPSKPDLVIEPVTITISGYITVAYDIKFMIDGAAVQPSVPVQITLPLGGLSPLGLYVFHESVNESITGFTTDGTNVTFTASAFSSYILANKVAPTSTPTPTPTSAPAAAVVKTGESGGYTMLIGMSLLAAAAAVILVRKSKRSHQEHDS